MWSSGSTCTRRAFLYLTSLSALGASLVPSTALALDPIRVERPEDLAAERAKLQASSPEIFAPVKDDPALPRVLIIGDSISIGYTPPVRELLHGVANVHRVFENGGPTNRGLQELDTWLGDGHWAVIHFNFGLHDIALQPDDRQRNPPGEYARNLRMIVTRLKATGAKLTFAMTTPVPATLSGGGPRRRNADVLTCNEAARAIMAEFGVPVNDLYAYVVPHQAEWQMPANVHYTPEGYRELAKPVAAAIRAQLPAAATK